MKELGLQLYTIEAFMQTEDNIRESFQKMRSYGYTQAQTAGCSIAYADFGRIAKEEGIRIIGTHDDFDMMVNAFDQALENHKLLGTTNMGIGGKRYSSLREVETFIDMANLVAKKAAQNGMKFTYHHHSHEFFKWDNGKTTMEMLLEGLDPHNTTFVLDTYWLQHGGADIRYWIEKLAGRVDIIHLKDMKRVLSDSNAQQITEVGNGNLCWDLIIESARRADVKYYVVEQDNGFAVDCFQSIKHSAEYLKQFIA